MTKFTKLKGKRFRSAIADCNCLWEVKGSRGRGVFECEVVNEPVEIDGKTYDSDFAGRVDVFTREYIEAVLTWEEHAKRIERKHEGFYEGLDDGQVVHYHDGFGAYVRCHVVRAEEDVKGIAGIKKGERCLRKVALVGNWRHLGSHSYHVKGVEEGRLFKPNASNIWENPEASCRRKQPDPRHLAPLERKAYKGGDGFPENSVHS